MPRRAMVQKSADALVTSTSDFLSAAPARRGASAVPATTPAASGNSSRRFILIPLIRASPRASGPGSRANLVHRRIQLILWTIANLLVYQGLGFDYPESSVCVAALATARALASPLAAAAPPARRPPDAG